MRAADLDVLTIGSGPRVVLAAGSIVDAQRSWRCQLDLAEDWTLVIPNRPGFGASPPLPRPDFELEAPLIAELLGDGAHLVGHSYGGVIALLAAALRPEAVHSLTVSEPGLLALAADTPQGVAWLDNAKDLYERRTELSPRDFVVFFRAGVESTHETPDVLPDWLEQGARLAMQERAPWEAEVPFERLVQAGFPIQVISGGHSPVFDRVCDVIAERLQAERVVIGGRGHTIPTAETYNVRLTEFMRRALGNTPGEFPN